MPLNTFQRRYILPFLGGLAVVALVFVWLILQQQAALLDTELQKKGRAITEELVELSNINLLLEDFESLQNNLVSVVTADEDVADAAIFGRDKKILVHYDSLPMPAPRISFTKYSERNLKTAWEFVMPIVDNTDNLLGTAVVRLSRARVLDILQQSATKLIFTTAAIFLVVAIVVYWLLTRVRIMAEAQIQRAKEIEQAYLKLKELQDILKQANESLELQVADRTKALAKMNGELQKVNTELKDFAYIVSHDLKAPLRAISSLTNWIVEDYSSAFDEDGQEQMNLLQSRVNRMYQLLEGILRYSRLGRGEEQKEILELNSLVEEVISVLLPSANFEIKIINDLPPIFADRTKIYQVFQNLISNAIKYNDKPVGKVTIFSESDPEKQMHYFSIADNGKGIPEEDFERVFKIFQTLEKNKESAESTGVGLTLVQKIIKKYGGNVTIQSTVGEGTTFIFSMPFA
jgi:signal transduction histidine kinase